MIKIYEYENNLNKKVYVGQTDDIERRHREHVSDGKRDKSGFDRAFHKYGENGFILTIIGIVETDEEANFAEKFWIAERRTFLGKRNVYNQTDGGGGTRGWKHSDETKAKMSKAAKGKIVSEQTKALLSARQYSDETREKMSKAKLGRKLSEETKENMSQAHIGKNTWSKGRSLSEEHKSAIVKANTGRPCKMKRKSYRFSDEQISQMKIMYAEGNSMRAIGRAFDCSHTVVSLWVKK